MKNLFEIILACGIVLCLVASIVGILNKEFDKATYYLLTSYIAFKETKWRK